MPADVIGTPGALTDIPMQIGYGVSGTWFEMYFTDPTNPAKNQEQEAPMRR